MKKEVIIKIPTSLSDIKLVTYLKLTKLINEMGDDVSELDKVNKLISVVCEVPESVVRGMQKKDIDEINVIINQAFESNGHRIQTFIYNGKEYGLIPNFNKMSFGEYIDIDNYIKNEETYPELMAVLYRPIVQKSHGMYRIADYTGEEEPFYDCPMDVVKGALVFFYNLGKDLSNHMIHYLKEQGMEKEITQLKQHLVKLGVGTNHYMDLLKGI